MLSRILYTVLAHVLASASDQNSTILDPSHQNGSSSSTERVGFVWGSNNRSTLLLLWSCIATILSCTWTVLHLSCPAPDDGYWRLFFRKTKWMLITLVAPEFTFSIAALQWYECRDATAQFRSHGYSEWTMTHSFYARVGGFVLESSDSPPIPLFPRELFDLLDDGSVEMPTLSEDSINDRSKADAAVKLFTVIQSGWFVIQCISRAAQDLPLSELEVTTMAFVFVAISTYACWWNKPLAINTTTHVKIIGDNARNSFRQNDLSHFNVWDFKKNQAAQRIQLWTSGFWTSGLSTTGWNPGQRSWHFYLPLLGAATAFGSIHCVAWNVDFATNWERIMWRVCALVTSLLGTLVPLCPLLLFPLSRVGNRLFGTHFIEEFNRPFVTFLMFVVEPLARIALMFEALYNLRSLPSKVYISASWVNYIPHIG